MRGPKAYSMEDLGVEALVGRTVEAADINESDDFVLLKTTTGPLYLTWNGDCCAQCFLAHVSNPEALVGATILSVEATEWKRIEEGEYGDVVESMGTTIKTTKGTVTFESRVSHNGYYGGYVSVSDDEPIDGYSSPRDGWQAETMKKLTEF